MGWYVRLFATRTQRFPAELLISSSEGKRNEKSKMLLQQIKGGGSNWICFAGYSSLICLLVILSGFYCFLSKQWEKKMLKIEWLNVRWEHDGTFLSISALALFHTQSCPPIWALPPSLDTLCYLPLHILTVSCLWRLMILPSVFKEAHHSGSPWPFISAVTDRQHSLRWKAHRKGRETAGRRQYGYTEKYVTGKTT